MLISVIVPTYNGARKLPFILESLIVQSLKPAEIIVVVDGSTDNTIDVLNNYKSRIHNFKIVEQTNKGRAAVRNRGVEEAMGDLLIFFDDDMRLEPHCVEAHIEHHQNFPNSILTGAQIDDSTKAKTNFQLYKCSLSKQWVFNLAKRQGKPQDLKDLHITAANFSIPKSLFIELGGFDKTLRDCEDYDFALRAFARNIPIYYSDAAFGWHDDFPTPASFIKRQLEYKLYNQALYHKDPENNRHLKETRLKKPSRSARMFFFIFKSTFWVKAIESNLLLFLPRPIRYKIYTWIITSHSTYKEYL